MQAVDAPSSRCAHMQRRCREAPRQLDALECIQKRHQDTLRCTVMHMQKMQYMHRRCALNACKQNCTHFVKKLYIVHFARHGSRTPRTACLSHTSRTSTPTRTSARLDSTPRTTLLPQHATPSSTNGLTVASHCACAYRTAQHSSAAAACMGQ